MFSVPGFTQNCPACVSLDKDDGVRRGGHTYQRRARMEIGCRNLRVGANDWLEQG